MYMGKKITTIGAVAADLRNLADINSKDGRLAGDKAIIHLGRFMQEAFPEGYVFSFGNGEIIAIDNLTDDSKKRVEEAVAGVREKLSAYTTYQNYSVPLDIYFGYAEGKPEDRNDFERIASIAVTNKNAYKLRIRSRLTWSMRSLTRTRSTITSSRSLTLTPVTSLLTRR